MFETHARLLRTNLFGLFNVILEECFFLHVTIFFFFGFFYLLLILIYGFLVFLLKFLVCVLFDNICRYTTRYGLFLACNFMSFLKYACTYNSSPVNSLYLRFIIISMMFIKMFSYQLMHVTSLLKLFA